MINIDCNILKFLCWICFVGVCNFGKILKNYLLYLLLIFLKVKFFS